MSSWRALIVSCAAVLAACAGNTSESAADLAWDEPTTAGTDAMPAAGSDAPFLEGAVGQAGWELPMAGGAAQMPEDEDPSQGMGGAGGDDGESEQPEAGTSGAAAGQGGIGGTAGTLGVAGRAGAGGMGGTGGTAGAMPMAGARAGGSDAPTDSACKVPGWNTYRCSTSQYFPQHSMSWTDPDEPNTTLNCHVPDATPCPTGAACKVFRVDGVTDIKEGTCL